MLNSFPDLLTYSFIAPTLLRVVVALVFAYLAYAHYTRRRELGAFVWVAMLIEAGVAFGLLFGYYTQIASIVGTLVAASQCIYAKRHPRATPLCRVDYVFVIAICLSLLLTGAGAYAFDLPL